MILSVPPRFGVRDKDVTTGFIVVYRWKDKMFKHKQHKTTLALDAHKTL